MFNEEQGEDCHRVDNKRTLLSTVHRAVIVLTCNACYREIRSSENTAVVLLTVYQCHQTELLFIKCAFSLHRRQSRRGLYLLINLKSEGKIVFRNYEI